MIAQKKTSKKRTMILGGIVAIAIIATIIMLYFIYREPDIALDALGGGLTAPAPSLDTTFNTEIFEDSRVQNLRQFGPAEVQVQFRGRSTDPFQPF